jgi:hyperosmotically inducible protein
MCRDSYAGRAMCVGLMVACLFTSGIPSLHAQQPPAPDNTKVNARDRQPSQVTADQQKNDKTDVQITSEIRKAVVADKSLSTYAHNVKIIARHGKVTLKGPVRSDDEKKLVEAKAAEVVGASNVINQTSVAPIKRASNPASNKTR